MYLRRRFSVCDATKKTQGKARYRIDLYSYLVLIGCSHRELGHEQHLVVWLISDESDDMTHSHAWSVLKVCHQRSIRSPELSLSSFKRQLKTHSRTRQCWLQLWAELSMGWVDPWVELVGLGQDFSVFGGLGWVHYCKSTKTLKRLCQYI